MKCRTVSTLELLDNNISHLGCEFIARILGLGPDSPIEVLKLDHNDFGTKGVIELVKGLNMNAKLTLLSLCYCDIDVEGSKPLIEIIIYTQSTLRELILKGNQLGNVGLKHICDSLRVSKSLEAIDISDNQISDLNKEGSNIDGIKELGICLKENKIIKKYNLQFNSICDDTVKGLINCAKEGVTVTELLLSERVAEDLLQELDAVLKVNKAKGKKKKGKKKGKKK